GVEVCAHLFLGNAQSTVLGGIMRHSIYQFAWLLALSAGLAVAQKPSQEQERPSTTPPVVSSDTPQQNPDQMPPAPDRRTQTPVSPDEDKPPSSQTSTMTRGTA